MSHQVLQGRGQDQTSYLKEIADALESPEWTKCPITKARNIFATSISRLLGCAKKSNLANTQKEKRFEKEVEFYQKWIEFHNTKSHTLTEPSPSEIDEYNMWLSRSSDFQNLKHYISVLWKDENDQKIIINMYYRMTWPLFRSVFAFSRWEGACMVPTTEAMATFPIINGTAFLFSRVFVIIATEGFEYARRYIQQDYFRKMLMFFGVRSNRENSFLSLPELFDPNHQLRKDLIPELWKRMHQAWIVRNVTDTLEYAATGGNTSFDKWIEKFWPDEQAYISDAMISATENMIQQFHLNELEDGTFADGIIHQVQNFMAWNVSTGCPFFWVRYEDKNQFQAIIKDFTNEMLGFMDSPEGKRLASTITYQY